MSNEKIISRKKAKELGLTHYFTGKPCPHGHVCERFVSSFTCVECGRDVTRKKSKGIKRSFVSDEELIELIKSFSSYSEFRNSKEYTIAMKRGFHDFAIELFGYGKTTKRWDEQSCIDEAKKFSARSDFAKNSSGAYDAALNLGILEECCAHMKRPICDADTFYVWGFKKANEFVCKIGVTSKRLGFYRVEYVSSRSGFSYDFVWYSNDVNARYLENKALNLGLPFNVEGVNGGTEFRIMSKRDLEQVWRMTEWNNVAKIGFPQGAEGSPDQLSELFWATALT